MLIHNKIIMTSTSFSRVHILNIYSRATAPRNARRDGDYYFSMCVDHNRLSSLIDK